MDEILTAAAPEEQAEQEEILIATVGAVTETGVTLIFAGEESASEKTYRGNVSAALKAGDRVKITKDSGTYLIDYAVGVPGSAAGGNAALPTGGTKGQALVKNSSADGDVKWDTINGGLPAGGTDGQILAKNGATNYTGKWIDNPIPTGGTDGQVLMKSGKTDRSLKFGSPTAGQLVNGTKKLTLASDGVLDPSGTSGDIALGRPSAPFKNVYANGTIELAQGYSGSVLKLGGSSATIGFFGVTPVRRPTVSASATVAQVITALKSLGLFQ